MHRFLTLALTMCLAAAAAQGGETVRIKGSDTIGGALAPDLAAAFRQDRPAVTVTVESLGSKTAFVGLFDGSADLGASSRPANSREMEQAASRGVVLREWILGFDGVAVIVHASNPISGLTIAELSGLFSGAIKNWREVGGENRAVRVISRPSYSGTHAFFKEQVLRRGDRRSQEEFAASTTFLEHNEDIVNLVSREIDAVAYVGLGWVDPRVKPLQVSPSAGQRAVSPSLDHVRTGSYPLYRPLLLYTLGEPKGETLEFLRFALSDRGRTIVERHGFVPSDAAFEVTAARAGDPPPATKERVLYRVHFPFGATALTAEALSVLREVGRRAAEGGYRVHVVGHGDAIGSSAANRSVSLARARAAAHHLQELGVPAGRLSVEGRAAEEPIATNESSAGRAANRRVDISLLPLS